MKTEGILNEREKTHGDFEKFADCRVELGNVWRQYCGPLNNSQTMAIAMILTKLSRIFCGDPNHADHWDDIAGYAMLGRGETKDEARARITKELNLQERKKEGEEWFYADKVKMPFDAPICLEILHSDGRKSITLPVKQGYDGTCTMYSYDINGNKNEYEVYFIGSVIRWKYAEAEDVPTSYKM